MRYGCKIYLFFFVPTKKGRRIKYKSIYYLSKCKYL